MGTVTSSWPIGHKEFAELVLHDFKDEDLWSRIAADTVASKRAQSVLFDAKSAAESKARTLRTYMGQDVSAEDLVYYTNERNKALNFANHCTGRMKFLKSMAPEPDWRAAIRRHKYQLLSDDEADVTDADHELWSLLDKD